MFPSMATFEMAINHHVSTAPNTNQINIEPPTENIPYVMSDFALCMMHGLVDWILAGPLWDWVRCW